MDWISETITTTTGLDEISQFFVKLKNKKVKFNTQKSESKYTILSSRKTMKSRVNEQDTTLFSLGFDSRLGFADQFSSIPLFRPLRFGWRRTDDTKLNGRRSITLSILADGAKRFSTVSSRGAGLVRQLGGVRRITSLRSAWNADTDIP